jgi:hypothetical protein
VRRKMVKQRVGPALYQVMEPGDQIIAGTWAQTGPSPLVDTLASLPFLAVWLHQIIAGGPVPDPGRGLLSLMTFLADSAVGGLLPLALLIWRRPVFIAVTQRQLICYGLTRLTSEPARLLFTAPLAAVRIRPGLRVLGCRSVRYDGPGAGQRPLRLSVSARWRHDLDQVLTAVQAGGAIVQGRQPAAAAALELPHS